MKNWRIAFVIPRYGEDILGGAETLARCVAERMVAANIAEVEVLTTCARDHVSWANELPPGESMINGVRVRRFPIDHAHRDVARFDALHIRLIQRELIPEDEQYEWVDQSAHSPEMYAYIESHGTEFDFLIFIPYLFGTTYYGSAVYPRRSIIWLCLHDEVYAYLAPTRHMIRASLGIVFNTYPESRLAQRLYGVHPGGQMISLGFDSIQADGGRFKNLRQIREPFILYTGRMEGAKNLPLLLNYFLEYKRRNPGSLKLVLMGKGPARIPTHPDVLALGFVSAEEMHDGYAASTLVCQPSVNESLSISIIEAWLCGAPALVHSDCEVTRYNVVQSNGGLYFGDYEEFEATVNLVVTDEKLRQAMALAGKKYVQIHYNWEVVLQRLEKALVQWST